MKDCHFDIRIQLPLSSGIMNSSSARSPWPTTIFHSRSLMPIISVERTISMGHRLPSYNGICAYPHGHNVSVIAQVEVNEFYDFKTLDNWLDAIIKDFDHAMVLHAEDEFARIHAQFFGGARLVLLNVEPTTENIASYIFTQLQNYSQQFTVSYVTVQETAKYGATADVAVPTIQRIFDMSALLERAPAV
jgi:6-pyruvoyl-tetrahydropterin synthase